MMQQPITNSISVATTPKSNLKDELIFVPHRAVDGVTLLPPWIVHVFQGKPAHQTDSKQTNASTTTTATTSTSSSSIILSLPSTEVVSAPTTLPFAAPTTKVSHDDHDMNALSPEQAAYYANEYGKVEQQLEIAGVLESLRYRHEDGSEHRVCEQIICHQVSVANVDSLVTQLQTQQAELNQRRQAAVNVTEKQQIPNIVVLNLCDGTETDGYPGVTIARALEQTSSNPSSSLPPLYHTGADPAFFATTTDKVTMKQLFMTSHVRTSEFVDLSEVNVNSPVIKENLLTTHAQSLASLASLNYPLIIKPTSSYSSCGLTSKSVVTSASAAITQAQVIRKELGSVLAEEYVQGREFSMLIVGDSTAASSSTSSSSATSSYSHLRCYTAAERAFASHLSPLQQFLTFEQNYPTKLTQVATWWQKLDLNSPEHAREQQQMAELACQAYIACRGRSYGRIDIRQSDATKEFYILEVNSLPGLSGELDSSVGAILSLSQPRTRFGEFLYSILHLACEGHLNPASPSAPSYLHPLRSSNLSPRLAAVQSNPRRSLIELLPSDILSRVIGPFLSDVEMLRFAWSSGWITRAVHPDWSTAPYQYKNEPLEPTIWCLHTISTDEGDPPPIENNEFHSTYLGAVASLKPPCLSSSTSTSLSTTRSAPTLASSTSSTSSSTTTLTSLASTSNYGTSSTFSQSPSHSTATNRELLSAPPQSRTVSSASYQRVSAFPQELTDNRNELNDEMLQHIEELTNQLTAAAATSTTVLSTLPQPPLSGPLHFVRRQDTILRAAHAIASTSPDLQRLLTNRREFEDEFNEQCDELKENQNRASGLTHQLEPRDRARAGALQIRRMQGETLSAEDEQWLLGLRQKNLPKTR